MATYEPSIPRVALGFSAVAMTALFMSGSVVLPAHIDPGSRGAQPRIASKAAPAPIRIATLASIDIVSVREPGSLVASRAAPSACTGSATTAAAASHLPPQHPVLADSIIPACLRF